ncbi:n-acetyltransferase 5 [Kwoniella heveanensis CBS 569]|nr:n-acetyltransferase 5 [Kwoniella heveanensis CBS 569]
MSIIRPFDPTDILRFNSVNADAWTATYHNGYYASYAAQWPDFCVTVEGAFDDGIKAYMIAKHEPPPPDPQHHGHLTALSICPSYRSLGLARVLMDILEGLSGESGKKKSHEHDHSNCGGHHHDHDHGHGHGHGHDHGHDHGHSHTHGHEHDNDNGHSHNHSHNHNHNHDDHDSSAPPSPKHPDAVDAWFVDLFVRCNNHRAIEMYERMGYSVYRRVVE